MALSIALHDVRVPTQRWVTHIALKVSGHDRPFVRAHWKSNHHRPAAAPVSQTLNARQPAPPSSDV
jgi:hypothetical protein